jgi:abortive infection bacteriophage resistance protein
LIWIRNYLVKERNVHHLRVHHERIKVYPQTRKYNYRLQNKRPKDNKMSSTVPIALWM